jgi:uncharacterized membrane protein YkvA (DUF1232 family)
MRWWRFARHPGVARAGGLWAVLRQAQLAFRLLRDERVPMLAKLVVPAAFVYIVSPLDLLPDLIPILGQVDDVGILLLGLAAFIKMCPSHLVAEHEATLEGRPPPAPERRGDEPIDAKYRWVDDRPGR